MIFTKNEVFLTDDDNEIYSCGFVQLVNEGYTGLRITDDIIGSGIIAVTTDSSAFYIEEYSKFDDYSGIIDNTYFSYHQTSNYVIEVSFKSNISSNYKQNTEIYDFDNNRKVNTYVQEKSELEKLYYEDNNAYLAGVNATNAISDFIDEGNDVDNLVVLDTSVIDNICQKTQSGFQSIGNFINSLLGKVKIGDSPLVSIDESGARHILGSENAMDAEKVATSLCTTVGSALGAGYTIAKSVATIGFCVKNGIIAIPVIVITTGACSIVYNISNMLAGAQDVYYGSKGDATEAENPVLKLFKIAIPDEGMATLVYNIWGIANTVLCSIMNPVSRALNIAKIKGLNTFKTIGNVARAAAIAISKFVITGVVAGVTYKYTQKVVEKITGSNAFSILVATGTSVVSGLLIYNGLENFDRQYNLSGIFPNNQVIMDSNNIAHYFDDNGIEYRVGDDLIKNNSYTIDGIKYTTDDKGRITNVEGQISLKPKGQARKSIRDSIDDIGKGDQLAGDQRGHLVADNFGGSNGLENIVAQDGKLNQGEWKSLELMLAQALELDKNVIINIEVIYDNATSFRPLQFIYGYSIDGVGEQVPFFN